MEMPGLACVLAKEPFVRLPNQVKMMLKKFLQVATPTARLMKQLNFHIADEEYSGDRIYLGGDKDFGISSYRVEVEGNCSFLTLRRSIEWNNPPLRPKLIYRHETVRDPVFASEKTKLWDRSDSGDMVCTGVLHDVGTLDNLVAMYLPWQAPWPQSPGAKRPGFRTMLVWESVMLEEERRLREICP